MAVEFDTAQVITALSLLVGSVATVIIALKGKKESDSNENDAKAIAVSDIKNTADKVEILWEHIVDLRMELDTLRKEKSALEDSVDELRRQLEEEQGRHQETRRLLQEALKSIKEKDKRIHELEEKLKINHPEEG